MENDYGPEKSQLKTKGTCGSLLPMTELMPLDIVKIIIR